MINNLVKFIEKLPLSDEQKSHLQLLIEKDREDLIGSIRKYLQALEAGEDAVVASSATSQVGDSRLLIELDKEMEKVTEVLNAARRLVLEVNESYNKINLLLGKKELWLADLVEKLSKVSNEVSDQFVGILQESKGKLSEIDQKVDVSWKEFFEHKDELEKALISQVTDIRNEQKAGKVGIEAGDEKINKLCDEFGQVINSRAKGFTNDLNQASEDIEKLTLNTTKKMKKVTRAQKLADLEKQIANI